MLGPFATASRLTPTHQVSLAVLSRAACASMSTTTTTTTTTHDRGDRYGPMEWAQSVNLMNKPKVSYLCVHSQACRHSYRLGFTDSCMHAAGSEANLNQSLLETRWPDRSLFYITDPALSASPDVRLISSHICRPDIWQDEFHSEVAHRTCQRNRFMRRIAQCILEAMHD